MWLNTHWQSGLTVNMVLFAAVMTAGYVAKATLSDVVMVIVTRMSFNRCIYDKELGPGFESKCPNVFLPLQNYSTVLTLKS